MRRAIAILAAILAVTLVAPASAALQSDNVSLLGKVPDSAGAIGARFSPDGETMYVTAAAWGTPSKRWGYACRLPVAL